MQKDQKAKNSPLRPDSIDRRLSVAPMMDWTDRHCRYFHRLLAPQALLFTEMVTAEAILHAGPDRFCRHHPAEAPLALQLGGAEPDRLAEAVRAVRPFGFAEINLNVGCPSDRVQSGRFGACLMAEPGLVAECVSAMQEAAAVPVSVKCRIGIDDMDPQAGLDLFVDQLAARGVQLFYIHARKAWLKGLSPKENREIPPLDYARVADLRARRPDLAIYLNGGLTGRQQILHHLAGFDLAKFDLAKFDGVMIGRAAYRTPWLLAELSADLHGCDLPDRRQIARQMAAYASEQMVGGARLHDITRHMLGLYSGLRGAKIWRRELGEATRGPAADPALIERLADWLAEQNEAAAA